MSLHLYQLCKRHCHLASCTCVLLIFKFPYEAPKEISLIYIHMQMSILRKRDILLKGRRKGEKDGEGSSAYHHSTDVQTKCVGLSVSSLRLSGAKLQRWPVWMDRVNQLLLRKKNISIVAVICSDGRGGRSQRIRMRTFSCQRAFGHTEEINSIPSRYSEGSMLQGGARAR